MNVEIFCVLPPAKGKTIPNETFFRPSNDWLAKKGEKNLTKKGSSRF